MRQSILRLQVLLAVGVVATVLILVGSGFVITAFFLFLSTHAGPTWAAAITGLLCIAGAAIAALMGRLALQSAQSGSRQAEQTPDAVGVALALGESLGTELQVLAKRHRFGAVGIALVAGFALGVSPKLRRSLLRLLEG